MPRKKKSRAENIVYDAIKHSIDKLGTINKEVIEEALIVAGRVDFDGLKAFASLFSCRVCEVEELAEIIVLIASEDPK